MKNLIYTFMCTSIINPVLKDFQTFFSRKISVENVCRKFNTFLNELNVMLVYVPFQLRIHVFHMTSSALKGKQRIQYMTEIMLEVSISCKKLKNLSYVMEKRIAINK